MSDMKRILKLRYDYSMDIADSTHLNTTDDCTPSKEKQPCRSLFKTGALQRAEIHLPSTISRPPSTVSRPPPSGSPNPTPIFQKIMNRIYYFDGNTSWLYSSSPNGSDWTKELIEEDELKLINDLACSTTHCVSVGNHGVIYYKAL